MLIDSDSVPLVYRHILKPHQNNLIYRWEKRKRTPNCKLQKKSFHLILIIIWMIFARNSKGDFEQHSFIIDIKIDEMYDKIK